MSKTVDCVCCGETVEYQEIDTDGICIMCNQEDMCDDCGEHELDCVCGDEEDVCDECGEDESECTCGEDEDDKFIYGFEQDDFEDTYTDETDDWEGDQWEEDFCDGEEDKW